MLGGALNVHCAHDDVCAALDTGWTILFAKDAQQAADQGVILRKVNELALNPGMNVQDGMLTTYSERMYLVPEAELLRDYLGAKDDVVECPTEAQKELFDSHQRRASVPRGGGDRGLAGQEAGDHSRADRRGNGG